VRRVGILLALCVLSAAACSAGDGGSTKRTPSTTAPVDPPSTTVAPTTTRPPASQPPPTGDLSRAAVRLETVATGLQSPVALAWRSNDGRLYVAEQGGRIRIVDSGGRVVPTPVLTVAVSRGNEQGLLGLTFSPDGARLYVNYTDPGGDTHVEEYVMRGDVADTATRRQLIFVDDPFPNHNGGEVIFGPDNMLYIGLGDGGSANDPRNNGQNLGTLFAKIMRIDPRPSASAPYTIPPDNPFAGRAGARGETWMWGLRNPWRFSFDRATRDLWIGDVGQALYEEIDFAAAGEKGVNFAWSLRDGRHRLKGEAPPSSRDPLLEIDHKAGDCAVIGGHVYRGRAIPLLTGVYVYGDSCNPRLRALVSRDGRVAAQRDLGIRVQALTTFGEDPSGEIYAAARGGTVYRLVRG
jgi:glucose/arabinose dehydrogenase